MASNEIKRSSLTSLSSSSSSSLSSDNEKWKYDVFLSFRGVDTRSNFISHLYAALRQKGIMTFKDDRELERGKTISNEIIRAIRSSRFSLVVFSTDYARSTWCLDELVEIYRNWIKGGDLNKSSSHTVFPIFYKVDAGDVEKQTGEFGEAFLEHEKAFNKDVVDRWRIAMTSIANVCGFDLSNREESGFIDDIVQDILRKLRKSSYFKDVARGFVGMDLRLKKMVSYLDVASTSDVKFIGIGGMGGIGKTTISRVVFESIAYRFEGGSFIDNVRENGERNGIVSLQEQLIHDTLRDQGIRIRDVYRGVEEIRNRLRSRRVLIVLDDVDELEHLTSLAGSRDWFGPGSRIIISTRNKHLLIFHEVDEIYEIEELDEDEALQLLRSKAFKSGCPTEEHLQVCHEIVKYSNGLPLALDVLGSFLFGKSIDEWRSALNRLKEIPNERISDKLKISFDGLERIDQQIFLDIACFFNGEPYKYVRRILDDCGFHSEIGIKTLDQKSLIAIVDNIVTVHHLLQEMGRDIVRREAYEAPGKRSRLWLLKDASYVLMNNMGTEEIQAIFLHSSSKEEEVMVFDAASFSTMKRLRLLKLTKAHLSSNFGLESLCSELRYIEWPSYPLKSLPSSVQFNKLIELHMPHSNIEQCWKKTMALRSLKILNLSYSQNLIKIAGFDGIPNLEELNLEGCTRLYEIHSSIGVLTKLVGLNLKYCKSIVELPSSICDLLSLKVLALDGCLKLDTLPERFSDLRLEEINASGVGKRELTTGLWQYLIKFGKTKPHPMPMLLRSFSTLRCLKKLNLSDCNLAEGQLPLDLSGFPSLEDLNISGNNFESLPTSINQLCKLETLCLVNCHKLRLPPELPSGIICLRMDGCTSLEIIPSPFKRNNLKPLMFTFVNCMGITETQGVAQWLKAYLSSILEGHRQGNFSYECDFSMCLPGSRIPACFNHRQEASFLKIELPMNWCNDKWIGFLACAVFGPQNLTSSRALSGHIIHFDLLAGPTANPTLYQDKMITYLVHGIRVESDLLWCIFIPRDPSKRMDWWNLSTHLTASFFSPELNVKRCGFNIVFEEDIEKLSGTYPISRKIGLLCDGNLDDHPHDNFIHSMQSLDLISVAGGFEFSGTIEKPESGKSGTELDPFMTVATQAKSVKRDNL